MPILTVAGRLWRMIALPPGSGPDYRNSGVRPLYSILWLQSDNTLRLTFLAWQSFAATFHSKSYVLKRKYFVIFQDYDFFIFVYSK
jgi:hypothetical protein